MELHTPELRERLGVDARSPSAFTPSTASIAGTARATSSGCDCSQPDIAASFHDSRASSQPTTAGTVCASAGIGAAIHVLQQCQRRVEVAIDATELDPHALVVAARVDIGAELEQALLRRLRVVRGGHAVGQAVDGDAEQRADVDVRAISCGSESLPIVLA